MMTKRHKFSPEFKARVVLELISGEKGLMQASREYEIKDSVLSRWKQEFLERAPQLFEQPQAATSPQDERIAGFWISYSKLLIRKKAVRLMSLATMPWHAAWLEKALSYLKIMAFYL